MRNKSLLRMLVVGCLVNCTIGMTQANYSSQGEKISIVNFGRIIAPEKVTNQLILSEKLYLQKECGVTLLSENFGLVDAISGRVLPWKRINLLLGEKKWSLAPNLAKELIIEAEVQTLIFALQISIEPNDAPGNYEGVFYLQPWKRSANEIERLKRLKILVKLTVAPWIKLEHPKIKIEINQVDSQSFSLSNEIPFKLRVASNAKWSVALALKKDNHATSTIVPVSLKLGSRPNSFQGISQTFQVDHPEFKRIAVGLPTINSENYWVELPLNFVIETYNKYPAGKYQFQFDCLGETLLN